MSIVEGTFLAVFTVGMLALVWAMINHQEKQIERQLEEERNSDALDSDEPHSNAESANLDSA